MKVSLVAQGFSPFKVISIPRDFDLKIFDSSSFNFDLYEIIVVSFSIKLCILVVITNTSVQI